MSCHAPSVDVLLIDSLTLLQKGWSAAALRGRDASCLRGSGHSGCESAAVAIVVRRLVLLLAGVVQRPRPLSRGSSAQRRFRCTLQLCWICQMFEDRALSLMNPRHRLEIASAYQCFFHLVLCCIYFVGDIQHIGSWCSKHASPWPS